MTKRDTGYITITEGMSDPYCNLCSTKEGTPIDARSIGFYTRQEQNVFTLLLCQTHRIDLMQTLAKTLEIKVAITAALNTPCHNCCPPPPFKCECEVFCEFDKCKGHETVGA